MKAVAVGRKSRLRPRDSIAFRESHRIAHSSPTGRRSTRPPSRNRAPSQIRAPGALFVGFLAAGSSQPRRVFPNQEPHDGGVGFGHISRGPGLTLTGRRISGPDPLTSLRSAVGDFRPGDPSPFAITADGLALGHILGGSSQRRPRPPISVKQPRSSTHLFRAGLDMAGNRSPASGANTARNAGEHSSLCRDFDF
jgi:hypothetical protein